MAADKHRTPVQLALAWLLTKHEDVVPIPGTSSRERLEENVRAADIRFTQQELDRIERATPKGAAAGDRYPEQMMALVDH